MHCTACVSKIEEALSSISGVSKVEVDLSSKRAIINGNANPDLLIGAVKKAGYNSLIINDQFEKNNKPNAPTPSQVRELFPLFLIFSYITIFSLIINRSSFQLDNFMYDFMGLFYIIFSFFKFLDYYNFPASFAMYDPVAKVVPLYGWLYPIIETVLGLFFILRFQLFISLIASIIILGVTTVGVTRSLLGKSKIQCACLGTALKLPMTKATLIENSIMITMAFWMLLNNSF